MWQPLENRLKSPAQKEALYSNTQFVKTWMKRKCCFIRCSPVKRNQTLTSDEMWKTDEMSISFYTLGRSDVLYVTICITLAVHSAHTVYIQYGTNVLSEYKERIRTYKNEKKKTLATNGSVAVVQYIYMCSMHVFICSCVFARFVCLVYGIHMRRMCLSVCVCVIGIQWTLASVVFSFFRSFFRSSFFASSHF